jgi:fructose-1-phosphate kinase PfkB-like protein
MHEVDQLTAGGTGTSVTSLLGLLGATSAEVISAGVDDQGTAQDALGTEQLDELVLHGAGRIALGIGLEVAQVTDVALGVGGSTVGLAEGVDYGRLA